MHIFGHFLLGLTLVAGALTAIGCQDSAETTSADTPTADTVDEGLAGTDATSDPTPTGAPGDASIGTADSASPAACQQAQDFQQVSADPANDAYPAPSLAVTCEGDEVVISSNGIPNFQYLQVTPNPLRTQDHLWRVPRYPALAAQTTRVPLGGTSAIAVNGLPIFGPTEAPMDGYRDPYLDEILDYCLGHTAPGGVYHYHARPDCIFADLEGNVGLVVGYALDGFPILAPYVCDDADCTSVSQVRSSYRQIDAVYGTTLTHAWEAHAYEAGSGDLDECNGLHLDDGGYAYFATDAFPYFMGCYRGTPNLQRVGPGGGP